MATATVRGDKTKFVNEFLAKNPQGNLRTVNEAWTAEGMRGTISKSVVDKIRAKLGLTGNLGAKSKVAAKPKTAPKRTRKATTTPGKAGFTKEFLNDHPDATSGEVNEAWTKAGMQGRISHTTVSEVRKSLGLIGKPRTTTRKQTSQCEDSYRQASWQEASHRDQGDNQHRRRDEKTGHLPDNDSPGCGIRDRQADLHHHGTWRPPRDRDRTERCTKTGLQSHTHLSLFQLEI